MSQPPASPSSSSGAPAASRFKGLHVAMISIGGIIGAGLFVGTSATIAAAGPAVLLSYLAAGIVVWLVMRLLGGLAINARGQGSFITHIATHNGPRAAFITGWSYAFLWAVTAGAQAVAGGMIIGRLAGVAPLWGALVLVAIAWTINRLSLRHYGQAETGLSIFKLLFLGGFIALGLGWLALSGHPFAIALDNITAHGGIFPKGSWAVIGAVPMIVQTFTGCEIAIIAATDSDRPLRAIAHTMRRLPLQVLFFYAGSVLVIISLLPWNGVHVGQSPFLSVLEYLRVPLARYAAIAVTLVAVLSCLNSAVYVVSRTLRELADLRLAPQKLTEETDRQVPIWSLRLTTLLELAVIAAAIGSPETLYPVLLGSSGGLILFIYFMIAIAYWLWARQSQTATALPLAKGLAVLIPVLGAILLILPSARGDALLSLAVILLLTLTSLTFIIRRCLNRA
ncbi:amino acid permease [Bombella apis]|uniref:Amino acid permease n=1 Tax=Bombella apis TaxID=1785988 RepID=A0ABR9MQ48_9PROT|nr:amino acid permease [Bombella apis]MBE1723983.1 amino acid permease [Bombella apis]MBR9730322.1 amino acid permease [Bombella apis]